jgi:hypothetical protein
LNAGHIQVHLHKLQFMFNEWFSLIFC